MRKETPSRKLGERIVKRGLPTCRTYNLTRNFRSGEKLLDSMHPWFAQWGQRDLLPYTDADRLHPYIRTGGDVSNAASVERIHAKDFAANAAARVERWESQHPGTSIGVLCRENWQAIEVQKAVRELGLPCELRVGGSFWASPAVRELRVLLEAVADPDDAAALLELAETRWAAGLLCGCPAGGDSGVGVGRRPLRSCGVAVTLLTRRGHRSFLRTDLQPLRGRVSLLRGLVSSTPLLEWVVECSRVFAPDACSLPGEDDETERRRYGRCLDHLLTLLDAQFQDGPLSLERLLGWLRLQVATNRTEDEPDPRDGRSYRRAHRPQSEGFAVRTGCGARN